MDHFMEGSDRVLLIEGPDLEGAGKITLQRPDGTRLVTQRVDASGWVDAVREQHFALVTCSPELLREHAFERGQRQVLELIASAAPLGAQLEQIVLLIEAQAPAMICSILLFDPERRTLKTGAAPNLPEAFVRAIDGSLIGPNAGSCGTAAYRAERVIVEDIATHPAWDDYRALALPSGLRACWSSPIVSSAGAVLGTFAMYFREARGPDERELHWVERATHIASIAIERATSEGALRASERLRALVHNVVTDVIFYIGVEGPGKYRFLTVNPAFCAATGLPESAVIGRLVEQVIPQPSRDEVLANYARAIAERRTVRWREVTPYPSGLKYGDVSVTPIFGLEGCTNLVGTVHDVTERELALQRITAQAALLDQANDAILVWDVERRIHYFNKGAERLYGYRREEVIGQDFSKLSDASSAFEAAERVLYETGSWEGEMVQYDRARKPVVLQASWTLLKDEHGRPKSVFSVNTNVTDRRQLELQVERAQRLESLGTLASGIAHDFNNILTAIRCNVDEALEEAESMPRIHEALSLVAEASARGAELVRQILAFSGRHPRKRERLPLAGVISRALGLLRTSLPPAVTVRTTFAEDAPEVFADATEVHQVVMNLVGNAAQAMPEGGVVRVSADRVVVQNPRDSLKPGVYARLTVADTGIGMDADTRRQIFDPFFTTKEPGKGSGLGLAVVLGILQRHEGSITVQSAPGAGSTFEAYFPAVS
jgi:PAS domain S-box-containing protein